MESVDEMFLTPILLEIFNFFYIVYVVEEPQRKKKANNFGGPQNGEQVCSFCATRNEGFAYSDAKRKYVNSKEDFPAITIH